MFMQVQPPTIQQIIQQPQQQQQQQQQHQFVNFADKPQEGNQQQNGTAIVTTIAQGSNSQIQPPHVMQQTSAPTGSSSTSSTPTDPKNDFVDANLFVPNIKLECYDENVTIPQQQASPQSMPVKTENPIDPDKPYQCDQCQARFRQSGALLTHKRTHTGERPFKCVVCNKGFTTSGNLKTHQLIVHQDVRPHKCHCGKAFHTRQNLTTHEKLIHSIDRSALPCSVCPKRFPSERELESHEKGHVPEHQYPCDVCGKVFLVQSNLIVHLRTHSGEKPYLCNDCGKGFTTSGNLNAHRVTHTKERPYVCKVVTCQKTFSHSSNLSAHVKSQHPNYAGAPSI
jgi:KRAB domain-containing zinc finger protein